MDVLSELLASLRFRATTYFSANYTAPWSVLVAQYPRSARFHMVCSGRCSLKIETDEGDIAFELEAGDFAFIPHGRAHVIADEAGRPPMAVTHLPEEDGEMPRLRHVSFGGGGTATHMLCGYFEFEEPADHPILATLPPALKVAADRVNGGAAEACQRLSVLGDVVRTAAGDASSVTMSRLAEILLIEAILDWHRQEGANGAEFSAFADRNISRSLRAIHAEPFRRWTVEELARAAGQSRASFAKRFHDMIGVPPIEYATQWRLALARHHLERGHLSVEQIAERVGYSSISAFARAFQRQFGVTPGRFRRKCRN